MHDTTTRNIHKPGDEFWLDNWKIKPDSDFYLPACKFRQSG